MQKKPAATIKSSFEFLKDRAEMQEQELAEKEKRIRRALMALQLIHERNPHCQWTWNQMEQARLKVEEIENKREDSRHRDFRTKWTMKGVKRIGEFFSMMKQKKAHGIKQLRKEDGMLTHDPDKMRAVATNFYKKLLTSKEPYCEPEKSVGDDHCRKTTRNELVSVDQQ